MPQISKHRQVFMPVETFSGSAMVEGRLVEIDAAGQAVVDFPGNHAGPLPAQCAVRIPSCSLKDNNPALLLAFLNGDAGKPVIIGLLSDRLIEDSRSSSRISAIVDGQRLEFVAQQEIVLRCGEGSITLSADGRIVLKGARLVSRASESNKIKGATVEIN